jgi:hypothetical protein
LTAAAVLEAVGNHANRIRQRVRNCPHQLPSGGGGDS